jgi:hypothetical protein
MPHSRSRTHIGSCWCCLCVWCLRCCRDECPQRGMLMTALRVFEALHAAVYARLPQAPLSAEPEASGVWDVRNVLAAEKKRVSYWTLSIAAMRTSCPVCQACSVCSHELLPRCRKASLGVSRQ